VVPLDPLTILKLTQPCRHRALSRAGEAKVASRRTGATT
jgi:hypothetical protein